VHDAQPRDRRIAIRPTRLLGSVSTRASKKSNRSSPMTELERNKRLYQQRRIAEKAAEEEYVAGMGGWQLPMEGDIKNFLADPIFGSFSAGFTVLLLFCQAALTLDLTTTLPSGAELDLTPVVMGTESAIVIVFGVELLLRWWSEGLRPRYLFNRLTLVDILSVAPVFLGVDYSILSVLRVARVLRLFRLLQKEDFDRVVILFAGLDPATEVPDYWQKVAQVVLTVFCIIWITAELIYEVEYKANPTQFTNFFDALYFSVTTLTTVGFGDIVPVTAAGRATVSASILTGVLLIPTQLSQLASTLVRAVEKPLMLEEQCAGCGLAEHDADALFCKRCGASLTDEEF